jgi:hypothetical protein
MISHDENIRIDELEGIRIRGERERERERERREKAEAERERKEKERKMDWDGEHLMRKSLTLCFLSCLVCGFIPFPSFLFLSFNFKSGAECVCLYALGYKLFRPRLPLSRREDSRVAHSCWAVPLLKGHDGKWEI